MNATPLRVNFTTYLRPHSLSASPPRSWIQVGQVGDFISRAYGKFSITLGMLQEMIRNFTPGRVPIDYDHLSNAPTHAGDGAAAGWVEQLEVRKQGTELWALTEWTPAAAERIRNGEYKFTSPSFSTDFTDTHSGKKIGTVLHAIAITNRPFLQQMQGISLCSDEVVGDIAFRDAVLPEKGTGMTVHLAEVNQKVSFIENEEASPELSPEERAATYVVVAVKGDGEDSFVKLALPDGTAYGWYPASALAPAQAPAAVPPAVMKPQTPTTREEQVDPAMQVAAATPHPQPAIWPRTPVLSADDATSRLLVEAKQLALSRALSLSEAVKQVSAKRPELVVVRDGHALPTGKASPVVSLSASPPTATTFLDLVHDLQQERKVGVREAMSLASTLRPDLALKYAEAVE